MKTELLQDNYAEYTDYLLTKKEAMFFASIKYKNFLEELLGDKSYYFIAKEEDKIVGILPCFLHKNDVYGNVLNSLPFYGSNGSIICDNLDAKVLLIDCYKNFAKSERCISSTMITTPFEKNNEWYKEQLLPSVIDKRISLVTYFLDSYYELETELLNLFHSKVRNGIKKAIKNGIEIDIDNTDKGIDFLYNIHVDNMKMIGGPPKKRDFFQLIPKYFQAGEDYNIYIAKKDGRYVAALLLFYFNNIVEYFTPVIVHEYRTYQPLSLIIYQAMLDSNKSGYKAWNWGGTGISQQGVYNFKKRWGATEANYYYYTNVYGKEILALDKNEILENYPNYFVYPFDKKDIIVDNMI